MKPTCMTAHVEIEITARCNGATYPIIDGEVNLPVSFKLAPLDSRVTIQTGGVNGALADALEAAAAELRSRP